MSTRPPSRAGLRLGPFVAAALGALGGVAGCLLVSDFDGVAGVRPGGAEAGEAGDGGGDAALSPCAAGNHVICSDFDHAGGGFPVPGWNHADGDGGTLSLANTTSVTAPLALNAKVRGNGGFPTAYLYRTPFVGAFTALTISFDMFIVECPAHARCSARAVKRAVRPSSARTARSG